MPWLHLGTRFYQRTNREKYEKMFCECPTPYNFKLWWQTWQTVQLYFMLFSSVLINNLYRSHLSHLDMPIFQLNNYGSWLLHIANRRYSTFWGSWSSSLITHLSLISWINLIIHSFEKCGRLVGLVHVLLIPNWSSLDGVIFRFSARFFFNEQFYAKCAVLKIVRSSQDKFERFQVS